MAVRLLRLEHDRSEINGEKTMSRKNQPVVPCAKSADFGQNYL